MLFFIFILAARAANLGLEALEPHIFSQIAAEASPEGTQKNIDDIQTLIGTGEHEREVALYNQSVRQKIYDDAFAVWQKAFDEEQEALGNQKAAEDEEVAATKRRDQAIIDRDTRIKEKDAADKAVIAAKKFMDSEIARVNSEHETLQKVKSILEGILPKSVLETHSRNLLSKTVSLLANPDFLAMLQKADPSAVQQVIDMVVDLINRGEDERQHAITEHNNRVTEAATAAQNLVDAEAFLADKEQELIDATNDRIEKTKIAEAKTTVEIEKRKIRDEKKIKLDIQKAFTAREIQRINEERAILETGQNYEGTLKKVVVVLQD